jgi:phage pi2 protein 07
VEKNVINPTDVFLPLNISVNNYIVVKYPKNKNKNKKYTKMLDFIHKNVGDKYGIETK